MSPAAVLVLLATSLVPPHGIHLHARIETPAMICEAQYDDHTTIPRALFVIRAPGMEEVFQEGHADAGGTYAFLPDRPGTWVVEADDGLGHFVSQEVEVDERFFDHLEDEEGTSAVVEAPSPIGDMPVWMRALWGLSLIAGLTGVAYGIVSRRSARRN